jgi:hypothetical protein
MHCKKKRHTSLKIFENFCAARFIESPFEHRKARRVSRRWRTGAARAPAARS